MKQSKDSISQQAIEWSILHLQKHGDTDIFPKPFEYTAVGDQAIREHVAKVDLACYNTRAARMILVPKAGYGFRVSHQLDPIDSIVYTASVYEISKDIERWRVPVDERIACSYRIQPTDDGDFFPRDNGWSSYSRAVLQARRYSSIRSAHRRCRILQSDLSPPTSRST